MSATIVFATYKYCLAQSTPSKLNNLLKRELNIDGVRAFFLLPLISYAN